jgi:hydroxypyruvate isomerase
MMQHERRSDPGRKAPFKQGLTPYTLGMCSSVEERIRTAAGLGAEGVDFFSNPADWPLMQEHGLVCSLYKPDPGGGVSEMRRVQGPPGWNAIGMKEAQGAFLDELHGVIDLAAAHGLPNVLLFAGTRHTVSYEEGAENAIEFCNRIKAHAETRGVTLVMELVNSKGLFGPPLSLFDHAAWGFDVCRKVNSPRVKVLYDIFHAQIMDGNIAATLRENIELIGHIHVAGVPGRHELDDQQELNFAFLAKVIAETGYRGFVSHEWIPSEHVNPVEAVRRSIALLDAGAAGFAA